MAFIDFATQLYLLFGYTSFDCSLFSDAEATITLVFSAVQFSSAKTIFFVVTRHSKGLITAFAPHFTAFPLTLS